jgi:hypothetical protein
MYSNMPYEWCDDERAKVYGIYSKEPQRINTRCNNNYDDGFLGHILRDIAQMDSGIEAKKFHWNEVVYQEIDYEPLFAVAAAMPEEEEETPTSETEEKESTTDEKTLPQTTVEDDMTYQGLVKNNFMYT